MPWHHVWIATAQSAGSIVLPIDLPYGARLFGITWLRTTDPAIVLQTQISDGAAPWG